MCFRLLPAMQATALATLMSLGADAQANSPGSAFDMNRDPVVSFAFKGGTYVDYVDAIQSAVVAQYKSGPVNILLPALATEVTVPKLTLVNVSVSTALDAATDLTDPPNSISVKQRRAQFGKPVFSIRVRLPKVRKKRGADVEPQMVRVYSFRLLTESLAGQPSDVKLTSKTILTAIETGLDFTGGPEAKLRYHVDSSLLFVRGTPEQTHIIENVVAQLEGDLSRLRQAAERVAHFEKRGRTKKNKTKVEVSDNSRRAR